MTFLGFYKETARRSLHRAWELGHVAHGLIIIGTGACVALGWHFGEHELIVVPFLVLLGAFLAGVFWFAYVIYRDEHAGLRKQTDEVNRLTDRLSEVEGRSSAAAVTARQVALSHGELNKLKQELKELADYSVGGRPRAGTSDTLPRMEREHASKVKEQLASWLKRARGEASKVSLSDYLATDAELEATPLNCEEVTKLIQRQAASVEVVLKKLS